MKKLILAALTILLSLSITSNTMAVENNEPCESNYLTNGLQPNQATLFYMYSTKEGHFFLDPLAKVENIVFVGKNDYKIDSNLTIDVSALHHGKRFIGTFANDSLWELVGLQEVKFE